MLNRTLILAVAAIAISGFAAAVFSYAAPGAVDTVQKPKHGQFTKPGANGSSKLGIFDPSKVVTKPGGNGSGIFSKPAGVTSTCGNPGQPACPVNGGGKICGLPGKDPCPGGGGKNTGGAAGAGELPP